MGKQSWVIVLALSLAGCSGSSDSGFSTNPPDSTNPGNGVQVTLSGSVFDGPLTQSNVTVRSAGDATVWEGTTDDQAEYSTSVMVSPSDYPLELQATGGVDLVTGTNPEFEMRSAALGSGATTSNINSYSTIIHATASAQANGLNSSGFHSATEVVRRQLNFGFDVARMSDPVFTPVQNSNISNLVRSSEALAEMIRRTRTALDNANYSLSADDLIARLGADLTDGYVDGLGNGADARVAATANIVSAQVLIETMTNELQVGGSDASDRLDSAIQTIRPGTSVLTSDLVVPREMITHAGIVATAAYAVSPSQDLGGLLDALFSMPAGVSASAAKTILPTNAAGLFDNAVAAVASGTVADIDRVNDSVRNSIGPDSVDLLPPVISLLGPAVVSLTVDDSYVEPGAVATDNREGDISSSIVIDNSSVDPNVEGEYIVTYNATDSAGNAADEVIRTVVVSIPGSPDTIVPVITLIGDNPLILTQGDSYVEPGATATDNVDGDISGSVSIDSSNVNTGIAGSYFVTYDVSDSSGNAAAQATRTVEVQLDGGSERRWEAVLSEMVGYAAHFGVTGGADKQLLTVTNLNDSGAGSLRRAVADAGNGGAWIRFAEGLSGTIKLFGTIDLVRDLTIDGRGADITIEGPGGSDSTLAARRGDQNWILMFIKLDGPVGNNNDLLNVQNGTNDSPFASDRTEKYWIFHVSFIDAEDEVVSFIRTEGKYTVQDSYFRNNEAGNTGFCVLISHGTQSNHGWEVITHKATWAGNFWDQCKDRVPFITVPSNIHAYNNYYFDWATTALHVSARFNAVLPAQVLFEKNVAAAVRHDQLVKPTGIEAIDGDARLAGNLFLNGAFGAERNRNAVFVPPYLYQTESATTVLRDSIAAEAGWQAVPFPD